MIGWHYAISGNKHTKNVHLVTKRFSPSADDECTESFSWYNKSILNNSKCHTIHGKFTSREFYSPGDRSNGWTHSQWWTNDAFNIVLNRWVVTILQYNSHSIEIKNVASLLVLDWWWLRWWCGWCELRYAPSDSWYFVSSNESNYDSQQWATEFVYWNSERKRDNFGMRW